MSNRVTLSRRARERHGAFIVFGAIALVVMFALVALSIDLGTITHTQVRMQNAVDAAALAAAQELTNAVYDAGQGGTDASTALENSKAGARTIAAQVASENGVFVDPDDDVYFGKRTIEEDGSFSFEWDATSPNVVHVEARRESDDPTAEDSKVPLAFAKAGNVTPTEATIVTSATAYVESRDIVVVLDYSSSMNDDSRFNRFSTLGQTVVEDNLDAIWDAFVASNSTFSNDSGTTKFPSTGFGLINSYEGTYVSSGTANSVDQIYNHLNLSGIPWPQEGKNSNGTLKGKKSASASTTEWKDYITWVRNDSSVNTAGYRRKFGYRTLAAYLGEKEYTNAKSEDLWRAPYNQFDAMKNGVTLLTQFLDDLDFGDHLGLVVYWTDSKQEHELNCPDEPDIPVVDLGDDWITDDYAAIDAIQRHKQAAHYGSGTGMGDGIAEAQDLLNNHKRPGARPTILAMTDGYTNKRPSGWTLASADPDWNWDELTDYDGDGIADYSTTDENKRYSFWEAKQCIDAGYTIHSMSVGSSSDSNLMEAIAFAGGGVFLDVPSDGTAAEFEAALLGAFSEFAAEVPSAELLHINE